MCIHVRTPGHVLAIGPRLRVETRCRQEFFTVRLQDEVPMAEYILLLGSARFQDRELNPTGSRVYDDVFHVADFLAAPIKHACMQELADVQSVLRVKAG